MNVINRTNFMFFINVTYFLHYSDVARLNREAA